MQLDFLAATFASASDGVAIIDSSGRLVSVNRAGYRMAGLRAQTAESQLPFHPVINLRYLDGRAMPANETPLGRALQGLSALDLPAILRKSDGNEVVIGTSASPVRDESGAIIGAVSIFRDVTGECRAGEEQSNLLAMVKAANERLTVASVAAQQAADEAEHRAAELQGILDNMVEGVLVANSEGQITLVNEAATRMLRLTSREDAMVRVEELDKWLRTQCSSEPVCGTACQSLARALAGEDTITEELSFHDPRTGRDVYLRTNAAPIRGQGGEILGAVAVARDVTELKEIDQIKEQFIALAAHELKTPVTIMKGFAQLLLRNSQGLSPQQRQGLEAISLGTDRIHAIVRDLLDISLLSSTERPFTLEQVELVDLVEQAWDRMAASSPSHRLRLTASAEVFVVADRTRVEQVIENLLDNAARYSPAGGAIEVDVGLSGGRAVVSVTDRGIGIPTDKQAGIFDRFYSAHTGTPHDYGGLGVGLYISRAIVLRHGGSMDFESKDGAGSTFRFSLPVGDLPSGSA